MRRFWLALLTLLATLSTEPMGSVQQGAHDRVTHSSPPPALAVVRTSDDPVVAELVENLPVPDPPPGTASAHSLHTSAAQALPVRPSTPHLQARSGCSDPPSLIERLPYDANAPPFRG